MTPTTSEAQRAELHKTIWRIANDLRGVDRWPERSSAVIEKLSAFFERFFGLASNANE